MTKERLLLAGIWIGSLLYVSTFLPRGWIPHDEGLIAQAAVRTLEGERPYLDFDEAYTGALNVLHVTAFRVFGVHLLAPRYALLILFAAFLPAVFMLARRVAPPWGASLLMALSAVWTLPNYFASLPSWYNLFFATWGALSLAKFVETNRGLWLVAAGACGGLSVLFKVTGAYFIAAAILFLLYEESAATVRGPGRPPRWPLALRIGAGALLITTVYSMTRARPGRMESLHFLLPTMVACILIVRKELAAKSSEGRLRAHVRRLGLFSVGISVPIALYLLGIGLGEVPAMLESLRYSISRQLATQKAGRYLPTLQYFWPVLPYMALLALGPYVPAGRIRKGWLLVVAGGLALIPIGMASAWYPVVWLSARSLAPAVVLVGGALLWRTVGHRDVPREAELLAFLFVSVAGMVSLVQFPFSGAIYFCYVAPLVALAAAALVNGWSRPLAILHGGVGLFYLGFALLRMNPGYLDTLGERQATYTADARLTMPRGGLRVPRTEADVYNGLVAMIREKSRGDDLWVGPDCPELYFLSERKNPERFFYGFQDPSYRDDAALLRRLDSSRVRVLVIQNHPQFSAHYRPALLLELARRFPGSAEIGDFTLRWRDGP